MKTVDYRTYSKALSKLQREVSPDRTISIYEMNWGSEPVRLGVNWAAIGTVSSEEAQEFARKLTAAAEAAARFEYNGYVITYGED